MSRSQLLLLLGLAAPAAAAAQAAHVGYTERDAARKPASFTLRIENISEGEVLKLKSGGTAPFVAAPVFWVLHTESDPLFTAGKRDRGIGLEWLAETGDPAMLSGSLQGKKGVVKMGVQNMPVGDAEAGPITPGKAYEGTFTAEPGQRLTVAFMFGQSNDLFYAPAGRGILLFDAAGNPRSEELTSELQLWDAGTEVNEEPGSGPNQAPRQKEKADGKKESKIIGPVRDGFNYPRIADVLRVTITAKSEAVSGM